MAQHDSVHAPRVQSLDRLGHRGYTRDDSAEILFRSFLQEALVSGSGMGRDVHSTILSIRACVRASMYVCVCVCVCVCVNVCVCMCEREREKRERESLCVCVCVCV